MTFNKLGRVTPPINNRACRLNNGESQYMRKGKFPPELLIFRVFPTAN